MGRAISVYIPAFGQGDIAFRPTALKRFRYHPDLRLVYIPISPSQTVYILLILPDPSVYILFIIPKLLNMTIKEEIQQNTNIDQPAGQDITLYIMQMEQSHWLISL